MSKSKAFKYEASKSSVRDRKMAEAHFRRWDEIIASMQLHEERGQGYDEIKETSTIFQTSADAVNYAANKKEKDLLWSCREYVESGYVDSVWAIATGHKKMSEVSSWERPIIEINLLRMYNRFLAVAGFNSTGNLREQGRYISDEQQSGFLADLADADIPEMWKGAMWELATGQKILVDYDDNERAELAKLYKDFTKKWESRANEK